MNTILKWIIGIVLTVILLLVVWFVFGPWIREAMSAPAPATVPTVDVHTQRFNTSVDACIKAGLSFEGNVVSGDVKCVRVPVVEQTESPETPQLVAPTATQSAEVQSPVVPAVDALPESSLTIGKWEVKYFDGVTDQMKSWTFKDLDPVAWKVFPNVDNGQYKAADGVEYGMAESVFCQQDQRCDFEVAARHYRLYTGDYKIDGIGECHATDGIGCAVAVFNGGDVTSFLASQEMHDGFTVTGRYWNGDKMPHAIWALLSSAVNNMLNLDSVLNPNGVTNGGANCSIPTGCVGVDVTFAITSGNQVLVIGHTVINK